MRLPKLEIVTGEVVKVQLAAEGQSTRQGGRKAPKPKKLAANPMINRMRIFVKPAEGKERDFTFANSTVGVREDQKVSVVRAKAPGFGQPLTVALYNHTTGQREEFSAAMDAVTEQRWIRARWRAVIFALCVTLLYWPISNLFKFPSAGLGWAIFFGIAAWPFLWGLGALTDAILLPTRRRAAETRLRAEMEGRLAHHSAP